MRGAKVAIAWLLIALFPSLSLSFSSRSTIFSMPKSKTRVYAAIEPGVGDEGCKAPSPSRINTLPLPVQAAVFAGVSIGLGVTTTAAVSAFELLESALPGPIAVWKTTWGLIGVIYALAGYAHFAIKDDFINIMPAQGSWGFWYLPGSKEFHVLWTGVVELLAGAYLAAGSVDALLQLHLLPALWANPVSDAASILLLLTILVTPANIYMYTHGARLPVKGPETPITFHLIRGAMQVLLFVIFYELATPTLKLLTL